MVSPASRSEERERESVSDRQGMQQSSALSTEAATAVTQRGGEPGGGLRWERRDGGARDEGGGTTCLTKEP